MNYFFELLKTRKPLKILSFGTSVYFVPFKFLVIESTKATMEKYPCTLQNKPGVSYRNKNLVS